MSRATLFAYAQWPQSIQMASETIFSDLILSQRSKSYPPASDMAMIFFFCILIEKFGSVLAHSGNR